MNLSRWWWVAFAATSVFIFPEYVSADGGERSGPKREERKEGEARREDDKPREGEARREGDRPREDEARREGDKPREGEPRREGGDRPMPPPRRDGEGPPREGGDRPMPPPPRRDGEGEFRPPMGPPREGGGRPPMGPPFDHERMKEHDPEMYELMKQDMLLERESFEASHASRNGSKEEREKAKTKVQELVAKQFTVRQQRRELQLKRLEKELDELRGSMKKREEQKEEIIKRRVGELVGERGDLDF